MKLNFDAPLYNVYLYTLPDVEFHIQKHFELSSVQLKMQYTTPASTSTKLKK
jgi:hypothetical protein